MVRVTIEEKVFEYDRNDKNTLTLVEIAEEMVKRDISIIETKRVRDRLQEIEEETKIHFATNDELGLKYIFVECLDGEDYDDVYRQIWDFYRAALLTKQMDEEPEYSIIEKLSELSLDYITEKSLTSALCGLDDKTVLIDDLRPLELNDEMAERIDEAIPIDSLDRVDEDIKQNFFGDKDGKRHWELYEEREKQTEYDRFVNVLDKFVSDKMTSLTQKLVTELNDQSFQAIVKDERFPNGQIFQTIVKDRKFPKWKWFRPDVHGEAKRIFDLWCGEFFEHRDIPISYMWSFLKSRLIINGWTNRGLGRKQWDWSEETTKEYPRFEYSKDWLNVERVEINYLQAIEEMLMNKWNKQSEKTAPIIDLNKWIELCNLLHELQKGKKIIVVRKYFDPKVFIVSAAFSSLYEVKSINCCPPFDDIHSSITIRYKNDKEDVVNVVNFSKCEYDDKKNIVTVWLTENIRDEEYKAFDVLFVSKDEQPIDDVDKVEKFKEQVDKELTAINESSTEKI